MLPLPLILRLPVTDLEEIKQANVVRNIMKPTTNDDEEEPEAAATPPP